MKHPLAREVEGMDLDLGVLPRVDETDVVRSVASISRWLSCGTIAST